MLNSITKFTVFAVALSLNGISARSIYLLESRQRNQKYYWIQGRQERDGKKREMPKLEKLSMFCVATRRGRWQGNFASVPHHLNHRPLLMLPTGAQRCRQLSPSWSAGRRTPGIGR